MESSQPTIKPFSHPDYERNAEDGFNNGSSCEPCAVCGKPTDAKHSFFVHVVDGGERFSVSEDDREDSADSMGFFPVDPACAKKLKKQGVFLVTENWLDNQS